MPRGRATRTVEHRRAAIPEPLGLNRPFFYPDPPEQWNLQFRDTVISPINLSEFLTWSLNIPRDHMDYWHRHLFVIDHRSPSLADHVEVVRPSWGPPDLRRPLRSIMCNAPNCDRCTSGRGGYKFQIVGPWTPRYLDITVTGATSPQEHNRICYGIYCGGIPPPSGMTRFASPPSDDPMTYRVINPSEAE